MRKGPLFAVLIAAVAIIVLYFLFDIKKPKAAPEKIEFVDNQFIDNFNKSLPQETQNKISCFIEEASNGSELAADSLIFLYETLEQYNFSAYYHTLKAEAAQTIGAWELAGDRQLGVSKNAAYDAGFNEILEQEAIKSYKNAWALDSNNIDVQVKLADAIVESSEQPMEGVLILMNIVKQDSMNTKANLALGKFGIVSQQYDKAIGRLEKVLSLQPDNTEALFLIAEAYANLGQKDKAIASLEKCKQLVENEELKKEIDAYLQQLLLQ
ncbi:MAG: tetratricopeptide repeat protein [Chitinophagales bacterium]|nr:tetratricopeptide repeat protein [Chitinophagales bacterium]